MKRLKNITGILTGMITLLLLLLAIYSVAAAYQEKRDGTPFFFLGWKPVLVLSDSMEPTFHTGSILIVREQETEEPEPGDIVMFPIETGREHAYVTHRIVSREQDGYITKGDNNNAPDFGIRAREDILGTVTHILF
jgi:signal peptidase